MADPRVAGFGSSQEPDASHASDAPDAAGAELETTLVDVRRALCTVRSHLVLVAPEALCRAVRDALVADLGRPGRAVVLELAGRDANAAEELLAEAVRATLARDDAGPAEAAPAIERLVREGASLVVLLPDATSIPSGSLRRLGELAGVSRKALRLALCVDAEEPHAVNAASALVRALGIGAEKIVRGGAPESTPNAASGPAEDLPPYSGPPRIQHENPGRQHPRVRVRRQPHARRSRLPVLAMLALAAVVWTLAGRPLPRALPVVRDAGRASSQVAQVAEQSAVQSKQEEGAEEARKKEKEEPAATTPDLAEHAEPAPVADPATRDEQDASELAGRTAPAPAPFRAPERNRPSQPESTPLAVAADVPAAPAPATPVPARASLAASAVAPAPVAAIATLEAIAPEPEAAAAPEPAEPATVSVSFNAQPWAHLHVDGRDIGPTPIANLLLTRGEHRVRASFPGGRVVERVLRVDDVSNHFRLD
jgi:hypothetical protein